MKTKREVLKRFAEKGYCSGIECSGCAYLELCGSKERLTIKGRLQKIGAMAILKMFPEKKKPLLSVGTKIKFSDGSIATIVKFNCYDTHYYALMFENRCIESIDWENIKSINSLNTKPITFLIDRTWEVVE